MNRRNARTLLVVLLGAAVWMMAIHLLFFSGQGLFGISGIGMTAVALMAINRPWLYPDAPPLPRKALIRSIVVAAVMGTGFSVLFGSMK